MAEETGGAAEAQKVEDASSTSSATSSPLSDSQLSLALSITSLLDGAVGTGGFISWKDKDIFLPDVTGRLTLSHFLVLDDVPWMAGPVCAEVRKCQRMVHHNISAKVAERMGVRSLRALLISKSVQTDNIFGDSAFGFDAGGGRVEAFGQVRLHHFLQFVRFVELHSLLFEGGVADQ